MTNARVAIETRNTLTVVHARIRCALVDDDVAISTGEARCAIADIPTSQISASAISTRIGFALIDVSFTIISSVTVSAITPVCIH